MKLRVPDYYEKFRCIAEKCTDNCCIGWEICIDDDTLERYRTMSGDLGDRLRSSINFSEQCFINTPDDRCPFLNERNLCDIITAHGESALCDICHRHPRYFEWFDDVIEGGIGMSCEEAARIILGSRGVRFIELDAPDDLLSDDDDEPCDADYTAFLRSARDKIIALLCDKSVPLGAALGRLTAYAQLLQELTDEYEIAKAPEIGDQPCDFDITEALALMLKTEPMYPDQPEYLRSLFEYANARENAAEFCPYNDDVLRNIAVYFVWRYFMKAVFSGNVYPKLMLAVFCTSIASVMFNYAGTPTFDEKCRLAKDLSKIIEYSEDNLELIMDHYIY